MHQRHGNDHSGAATSHHARWGVNSNGKIYRFFLGYMVPVHLRSVLMLRSDELIDHEAKMSKCVYLWDVLDLFSHLSKSGWRTTFPSACSARRSWTNTSLSYFNAEFIKYAFVFDYAWNESIRECSDRCSPLVTNRRRSCRRRDALRGSGPRPRGLFVGFCASKISQKIRAEVEFVSVLFRKQARVSVGGAGVTQFPFSLVLERGLCGAALELVSEASNGALWMSRYSQGFPFIVIRTHVSSGAS